MNYTKKKELNAVGKCCKEKVVVIDEKWVYLRNMPTKECQRSWVDSAGDRPILTRRIISDKKVLVIVATNYAKIPRLLQGSSRWRFY